MATEYESRGYLLDDFRLFHLSGVPAARVEYHYHEFYKLLMLMGGKGGYMVEGSRYSLEPGDVVLIGSHAVHRPEFEPDSEYERIIIYIAPEFLRRHASPECDLESCFTGARGHVLRPDAGTRGKLFALAARLERELSGREFGRAVLGNSLLIQLLVETGRSLRSSAALPQPAAPGNGRVQDILRYIDENLTEDLTIDHLSERFYISKYHMMRQFRRETGQSIHSYLSQRRLLHARELISRGMSATESCFRVGFRSYSSFTRAYGKHFGTTPTGRSAQLEETYE